MNMIDRNNFLNMVSNHITLTQPEYDLCVYAGTYRRNYAIEHKLTPKYGLDAVRNGLGADIQGAIGEFVVAKRLNLCWSIGGIGEPDVGGIIDVRMTKYPNGHLIIHEWDTKEQKGDHPDKLFVLVTGEGLEYDVRGWMYAGFAQHPRFWGSLANDKNKEPRLAFNVPQTAKDVFNPDLFKLQQLVWGNMQKNGGVVKLERRVI